MSGTSRDDDFRRAVADVAPLAVRPAVERRAPPPPPVPMQRLRDERAALAESRSGDPTLDDALDAGDAPSYLRAGLPRQVLRRLGRGHWVVEDTLDLHGMNRAQAAAGLAAFLHACRRRRVRCVRLVHGKGLGSRNREPVLKYLLRKLLPRRDEVLAYCEAPAALGGAGALLVLLKTGR